MNHTSIPNHLRVIFCIVAFCLSIFIESKAAQFTKATAYQTTGAVSNNSKNQGILYLKLEAIATSSGKWGVSSVSFTLANTNNADVTKAKIYINTANSLSGATRLDSISNPSGTITFNFNQTNLGINPRYLILVYDISSVVPCGTDVLDASVVPGSLIITGLGAGAYTAIDNNPVGNRTLTGGAMLTPTISINASSTSICSGTNVLFASSVSNGGTNPTYKWYVNGIQQASTSGAFSSSTFVNGDVVTCQLTSNLACASPSTATSNAVTITVGSAAGSPSVNIVSSHSSICPGTAVTFTPTASNAGASPTYKWYVNGVLKSTNSGAYTNNTLANNDVVYCNLTASLVCVS
ncbi:MAG: hypothetical protein KA450_11815, partial [Bacteroidia bacterium]|nr:hypothetical protein [Bacteroidia bacterium]